MSALFHNGRRKTVTGFLRIWRWRLHCWGRAPRRLQKVIRLHGSLDAARSGRATPDLLAKLIKKHHHTPLATSTPCVHCPSVFRTDVLELARELRFRNGHCIVREVFSCLLGILVLDCLQQVCIFGLAGLPVDILLQFTYFIL